MQRARGGDAWAVPEVAARASVAGWPECACALPELLEGDSDADGGFALLGQNQDGALADYAALLGSQADLPVDDVDAVGGDGLLSEEAGAAAADYGALLGPPTGRETRCTYLAGDSPL